MLKIDLTVEQKEQLAPLIDKVREANREGKLVAIGAQVWHDGIVVRLFREDQARALATALGGTYDKVHYSAADRINDESSTGTAGVPLDSKAADEGSNSKQENAR